MKEEIVKQYIKRWFEHELTTCEILTEQEIINGGLVSDLMIKNSEGKITHIIECKGSVDIGELAKGIGQCYQYNFQKKFNKESIDAEIWLVCPEDISEDLDRLSIPEGIKVYLVSEDGTPYLRTRHRVSTSAEFELQLPKTFFIRDIELNHIKKIITIIHKLSKKHDELSQSQIEKEIGKKYPEIAAQGYNHFITLRSLGLMNDKNLLTPKGHYCYDLIKTSETAFKREMCSYFYSYVINVLNAIILVAIEKNNTLNEIEITSREIADKICQIWGKKVRFLNDNRTVGTAMRIMKELGIIEDITKGRYKVKKLVHSEFLPWGSIQRTFQ